MTPSSRKTEFTFAGPLNTLDQVREALDKLGVPGNSHLKIYTNLRCQVTKVIAITPDPLKEAMKKI